MVCKGKIKGGIGWNLSILEVDRGHKDIIDNIIYTSVSRDQTSHQWQCNYTGHMIQTETRGNDTAIGGSTGLMIWTYLLYYQFIINEKLSNSNNNRSNPKFLRLLWDIFVLSLIVYLVNMICLNLRFFLQNLIYSETLRYMVNAT